MDNGRLPTSVLAPIHGGFLRSDAAAAFNALDGESRRRYGVALAPVGQLGSYRTYAQQVYLWQLYRAGRGNLAAYPGTSNHGWGLAVDFATQQMRWIVDQIGAAFGWSKAWSDAPSEWWHIRYRTGVWDGSGGGGAEGRAAAPAHPLLRLGARGHDVAALQETLTRKGARLAVDGVFGPLTEAAVEAFQSRSGLVVDGIVGPRTWQALRA